MVHARLYLICGNCGNSELDLFSAKYDKGDSLTPPTIYINCTNCGTIHDLSDNALVKPLDNESEYPTWQEAVNSKEFNAGN